MIRVGDWLQTYTGRQFWPMDPRADEVFIEDIAHSLAMQCRYAGHGMRFYSVAEHSVLIARAAPLEHALWGLLHDASEAYLVDVPRPVKRHLAGYKEAEDRVTAAITAAFGLPAAMPGIIHEMDNRIIADERAQNMRDCIVPWSPRVPLGVELQFWTPEEAERAFIDEFDILYTRSAAA